MSGIFRCHKEKSLLLWEAKMQILGWMIVSGSLVFLSKNARIKNKANMTERTQIILHKQIPVHKKWATLMCKIFGSKHFLTYVYDTPLVYHPLIYSCFYIRVTLSSLVSTSSLWNYLPNIMNKLSLLKIANTIYSVTNILLYRATLS